MGFYSGLNQCKSWSSFQAIRDGVIDATIDHEKGHVQSKVWNAFSILHLHV